MSAIDPSAAKAKWPFPPGHIRHGEPKEPSINAVWKMLEDDYGMTRPRSATASRMGSRSRLATTTKGARHSRCTCTKKVRPIQLNFGTKQTRLGTR